MTIQKISQHHLATEPPPDRMAQEHAKRCFVQNACWRMENDLEPHNEEIWGLQ